MRVFRLCREEEIQQILDKKSFENVGNYCTSGKKNSHTYDETKKYLHFFKKKSDLLYLNTLKDRFICVYNIPETVLLKHFGYGKYLDYIQFETLNDVEEFAIPCENIQFDYLESINKIIKDIDFEDMFENPKLKGYLKEVYNSENNYEKII